MGVLQAWGGFLLVGLGGWIMDQYTSWRAILRSATKFFEAVGRHHTFQKLRDSNDGSGQVVPNSSWAGVRGGRTSVVSRGGSHFGWAAAGKGREGEGRRCTAQTRTMPLPADPPGKRWGTPWGTLSGFCGLLTDPAIHQSHLVAGGGGGGCAFNRARR